jgi:predicted RecA/RadA family phage recombinase
MTLEGAYSQVPGVLEFTAAAAMVPGQVVQVPDGRAGIVEGGVNVAIGDIFGARVDGIATMQKTASVVLLAGQEVQWVKSTGKVSYWGAGDFIIGTVVEDAAAAATTCRVALNNRIKAIADLFETDWTPASSLGLGVDLTTIHREVRLAFDAVSEAALAAVLSNTSVACAAGPIFEAAVGIYEIGAAAVDFNFGLANASHATDADAITESAFFHLDAGSLAICAESDDGTTEVAATDTTVLAVDDTYGFYQIDARNLSDIQYYVNGVNVLPATVFKLNAATGPMKALLHVEKTTDAAVADLRCKYLKLRTGMTG